MDTVGVGRISDYGLDRGRSERRVSVGLSEV